MTLQLLDAELDVQSEPASRARRALLAGVGSAAFIATLGNRRAFAQGGTCGVLSAMTSANPSATTQGGACGGVTPGYWKNHRTCVVQILGGQDPSTVTLGTYLPTLTTCAGVIFGGTSTSALCNSSSICYHIGNAILCALSSGPGGINPSYGYTITQLQNAVKNAQMQGLSDAQIAGALSQLENDVGTNQNLACAQTHPDKLCP